MTKTETIHIRLSDDEHAALKRAAEIEARSQAGMGRALLVRGLRSMGLIATPRAAKAKDAT